jgi:hypothetical protein
MHETDRVRERRKVNIVLVAESEEANHLKDLGIDETIIVK